MEQEVHEEEGFEDDGEEEKEEGAPQGEASSSRSTIG
jgi:hypothetical protein